MTTAPRRALTASLLVLAAAVGTAGCDAAREAAGDLASSASAAVSGAARERMDRIKDGVNATGDVTAGPVSADGDRTAAAVTAANPLDSTADYTVMVVFRDASGTVLDAVVLTVDRVAAGTAKSGTARSNRTLDGATTAEVVRALRH